MTWVGQEAQGRLIQCSRRAWFLPNHPQTLGEYSSSFIHEDSGTVGLTDGLEAVELDFLLAIFQFPCSNRNV